VKKITMREVVSLLDEIHTELDNECDINEAGGPNEAMRYLSVGEDFRRGVEPWGVRAERAIKQAAPQLGRATICPACGNSTRSGGAS
jgi:hypothetical protein